MKKLTKTVDVFSTIPEAELLSDLKNNPGKYLTDDVLEKILMAANPSLTNSEKGVPVLKMKKIVPIYIHLGFRKLKLHHKPLRTVYLGFIPKLKFIRGNVGKMFSGELPRGLSFEDVLKEVDFNFEEFRKILEPIVSKLTQGVLDQAIQEKLNTKSLPPTYTMNLNEAFGAFKSVINHPERVLNHNECRLDPYSSISTFGPGLLSTIPQNLLDKILLSFFQRFNSDERSKSKDFIEVDDHGTLTFKGEFQHLDVYAKSFQSLSIDEILKRLDGKDMTAWFDAVFDVLANGRLRQGGVIPTEEKVLILNNLLGGSYQFPIKNKDNLKYVFTRYISKIVDFEGDEGELYCKEVTSGTPGKFLYDMLVDSNCDVDIDFLSQHIPAKYILELLKNHNFPGAIRVEPMFDRDFLGDIPLSVNVNGNLKVILTFWQELSYSYSKVNPGKVTMQFTPYNLLAELGKIDLWISFVDNFPGLYFEPISEKRLSELTLAIEQFSLNSDLAPTEYFWMEKTLEILRKLELAPKLPKSVDLKTVLKKYPK